MKEKGSDLRGRMKSQVSKGYCPSKFLENEYENSLLNNSFLTDKTIPNILLNWVETSFSGHSRLLTYPNSTNCFQRNGTVGPQ